MATGEINFAGLSQTEINLTDIIAKSLPSGLASATNVQKLITFIGNVGVSGYKGMVTPNVGGIPQLNGADITEDGFYIVSENGDYGSFVGLNITNKYILLDVKDISTTPIYTKTEIPLSIIFDSLPTEGSTNAVESGGLFNAFNQVDVALLNKANIVNLGNQLYDKDSPDIIVNFFMDNNGSLLASSTYSVTDYIRVKPSTSYIGSVNEVANVFRFSTFFDVNKNVILGAGSNTSSSTLTTTSETYYVRLSLFNTNKDTYMFNEGGIALPLETYKIGVPETELSIAKTLFRDKSSLKLSETDWASLGKNLFDKTQITEDFFVNWVNGVLSVSSIYSSSDFISISPSTSYVISGTTSRSHAFYDENKTFISGFENTTSVNSPANAVFVRFTINKDTEDAVQFEQGTVATGYQNYGYFTTELYALLNDSSNPWKDVETNYLGDSLTAQNRWQPSINEELSLNGSNFGIGGTKISGTDTNSFNNDNRINALSATAKLVCVLGGTNDWAQDTPLGTDSKSNVDVTTFNGALNVTIEKLMKRYSGTKQVFTLTLTGTSGSADISGAGNITRTLTFDTDLTTTASNFVTAFASDYLAVDIVLTSSGTDLIFTANILGLTEPIITTTASDLDGTVVETTPITGTGQVLFITPPYGELYNFVPRGWSNAYENILGLSINDYSDAIVSRCKDWSIPVAEVNKNSGCNNISIRSFMLDDGGLIHPNEYGAKRISSIVIQKLNEIKPLP